MEKKIIDVLEENFSNGIYADYITEKKIRTAYKEKYHEEIPAEFDLQNFIRENAFAYEGKYYFVDAAAKSKVVNLANELLTAGNSIIYYEQFYEQHSQTFEDLNIFSSELLPSQ